MSIAHVPEQDDTVAGELVQIQTLSTVLARNLRLRMEFVRGRFQFFDLGVEYPDPGEPVSDILAAISSGHTSGTADREIDFPSTLIKFLGNLRSRLPGSHHEHCTLWKG